MKRLVWLVVALLALVCVEIAGAGVTSLDPSGTVVLNGAPVFPIVLAKGPPRDGTTPAGTNALAEVVGAGVNFLKVGPATTTWTSSDITDANLWDQAAAAHGAYTWINLSTLSQATAGSSTDSLLQQVIDTLKSDPTGSAGIGMWKGADEPFWSGIAPTALQFAFCRSTSRGDASWCAGEPWLDQDHLWVTVEAPRGTASDLAPYSPVTDSHGEDEYPININNSNPDLHQVGVWTSTIGAATPNHAVWSTLQICSSGSYDGQGNYLLPTRLQERYMIYDAIINGARNLAFYGGNNANCWNSTDTTYGWSWTFWNGVLKGLIQEINAGSPIAPALVNPASAHTLTSSDGTTEVISRQGATSNDLWVFAARSGAGSQTVTISGLPSGVTSGDVYTENRTVNVSNGSFSDTFGQWDVHVYHFTTSGGGTTQAPALTSFAPTSGPVGTSVTITGSNLTGATAVKFNGTTAGSAVNSDTQITATVPAGASTGPISVTTPGGTASSSASFTVTSPAPTLSSFTPTSGPVGTSVTITGSNLSGATAVKFNGTTAAFSVNSDTQITATVPAGASTGTINVTTPGGTATSNASFTVTSPDFSLSAFPTTQTIRPGGSASYTVTVTPSGGFSGNVALSVSGLPAGANATFNPPGTSGTSTLTIQTSNNSKPGMVTLTITGTSGNLSHTATVALQIKRK
jgi:hypothetical protein